MTRPAAPPPIFSIALPGSGQVRTVTPPDPFDSAATLKRLGDGFYEQRLIADQIMAATGQRFVGDYTDNEAQYKALLGAPAEFAYEYGLAVGTALTEAQMRDLATDLVWLVSQTVTLPDGSTQTVLVPQVYLVVREGDLKGDGTLIAGRDVHIDVGGDIANSGTIGSRNATVMAADNILNQAGGSIRGARVDLNARQDIDNIAALIKGDAVALQAGRDVNRDAGGAGASGSASSTTRSGISEGVTEIRDDAGQQALTGQSAAETIASFNRDTTDTLGALKPIFDKEEIEAGLLWRPEQAATWRVGPRSLCKLLRSTTCRVWRPARSRKSQMP